MNNQIAMLDRIKHKEKKLKYKCQYCNKQFRYITAFKTHLIEHKIEMSSASGKA